MLVFLIFRMPTSTMNMKYSQVLGYFKEQKVKSFTFDPNDGTLTLVMSAEDAEAALKETQKLNGVTQVVAIGGFGSQQGQGQAPGADKDGQPSATAAPKDQELTYTVAYANLFLNQVMPYIDAYDEAHPDAPMVYDILPVQSTPMWLSFLPTIIMVVALGALFWMMMRQSGGGGGVMNVGKVKAKDQAAEGRKATFADVAGADEEKEMCIRDRVRTKESAKRHHAEVELADAQATAKKIGGMTVTVKAKAGQGGRLFGAVTGKDIAEAVNKTAGVSIDKRKVVLDADIKNYGQYEVEIKVYPSVTAKVTVVVEE